VEAAVSSAEVAAEPSFASSEARSGEVVDMGRSHCAECFGVMCCFGIRDGHRRVDKSSCRDIDAIGMYTVDALNFSRCRSGLPRLAAEESTAESG
jgi:hypothetical protein